jgi:putative transposase
LSKYDPQKHHRRSVRLKGYDYSHPGAYFVTICVRDRECVLGGVVNGEMRMAEYGRIVHDFWAQVSVHFSNVSIDTFVVMPNHVHAIIVIHEPRRGGVTPPLRKLTLGQIVAYYKYQTTKQINKIRDNAGTPFWQRSFYDHVIRHHRELDAVRQYIADNPLKWELDQDNPINIQADWRR